MKQKEVVYVVMSADIVHPGHINILRIAKEYAQKIDGEVVLGLLTDSAIASYKRVPFMNFEQRKTVIESLKYVDRVVAQDTLSYEKNIRMLLPRYVVHGSDWKRGIQQETRENVIRVLDELGCGQLVEPEYTQNISSTVLNSKVRKKKISTKDRAKLLSYLFSAKKNRLKFINIFSLLSAKIGNCTEEFDAFYFDDELASLEKNEPISLDEKILIIEKIFNFSNKPLICDLTFSSLDGTINEIQRLQRIGVSGVVLNGLEREIEKNYNKLKKGQIDNDFFIFLHNKNNSVLGFFGIDGFLIEEFCQIEKFRYMFSDNFGELLFKSEEKNRSFKTHFIDDGKIFKNMVGKMLSTQCGDLVQKDWLIEFFKRKKYEKL